MDQRLKQLKKRTMRRIYTIWFVRRVLPIVAAELIIFVSAIIGAKSYVSFGDVLNNAVTRATHYPLGASGNFWLAAFAHTEWLALLFMGAALVLGGMLARNVVQASRMLKGNFLRFRRVI